MQHTVIAYIAGTSPRQPALAHWAASTLHHILKTCTLVNNGFFKATFSNTEGVQYTLNIPVTHEGLSLYMQQEPCLRILASRLGEVLHATIALPPDHSL
uniref:Uncharacterized protein n=1 Tax=Physcomitrium patens TaxID=3218 RepID=A0A2K1JMG0_PHYPA|nr:hypothetical protein PHYPA_017554 [Physcomitrium patens]